MFITSTTVTCPRMLISLGIIVPAWGYCAIATICHNSRCGSRMSMLRTRMTTRHPRALSRRQFLALAAAIPALRAAVQPPRAAAQAGETPAQIAVQAGRELWRIPPGVRGFNFWGTRSDAAFIPEYRKIGLNLLRFPPGQAGDQAPVSQELISDSAKVVQAVGGDMVVEVRLRGGTPEQAAKSVHYANAEKKYGARFWEVGNEPDLYPQRVGEPDISPAWYNQRF